MTLLRALVLLFTMVATAATSGAWPRPEGETFMSLKFGRQGDIEVQSLYAEYGMSPRLTFGLAADRYGPQAGAVSAFSRVALTPDRPWQVSVSASASFELDGGTPEELTVLPGEVRNGVTLHVGRGFTVGDRDAWFDVEAGRDSTGLEEQWRMGLVAGIQVTDRSKLFVEFEGAEDEEGTALRIAPNAAYSIADGIDLTVGYAFDPSGDTESRIDLGAWLAF
ncbi:hypothetical protein SAMN04488020_10422 [Palleronia marisminoris]|uniref:Porin domain-containing protein n=1 Tax=Palleronia marisminoris TaxID=315423 RepID=A0A1Y5SFP4_9RHOB|nr:hypothetical protein [Palleronia marisminoris]SFG79346.1 hypothetical protein SAMN04488020_10422 [Palleronia marisminoris]SLN39005.1 hypothetical protein PAM7066_01645 [Palleronia marisminoris]